MNLLVRCNFLRPRPRLPRKTSFRRHTGVPKRRPDHPSKGRRRHRELLHTPALLRPHRREHMRQPRERDTVIANGNVAFRQWAHIRQPANPEPPPKLSPTALGLFCATVPAEVTRSARNLRSNSRGYDRALPESRLTFNHRCPEKQPEGSAERVSPTARCYGLHAHWQCLD